MAQIFQFPESQVRNWCEVEQALRDTYDDVPDGPATIDACIEKIKSHWEEIFVPFDTSLSYTIPGPLSDDQISAVREAEGRGQELMFEKMRAERLKLFGKLVTAEYLIATMGRNGKS